MLIGCVDEKGRGLFLRLVAGSDWLLVRHVVIAVAVVLVVSRVLRSHTVQLSLVVPFLHIGVNILDKLVDALAVIRRKLLNVVVAGPIDIVWRVLVPCLPVQLLRVVERHDLVALAVDDVDGAVDVGHAINVGELVER